jgi:hypothetical protein
LFLMLPASSRLPMDQTALGIKELSKPMTYSAAYAKLFAHYKGNPSMSGY